MYVSRLQLKISMEMEIEMLIIMFWGMFKEFSKILARFHKTLMTILSSIQFNLHTMMMMIVPFKSPSFDIYTGKEKGKKITQ